MTTYVGRDGVVEVGADIVAETLSWSVDEEVEDVEDTAASDSAKTYKPGQEDCSAEIECMWDDADTAQEALTIGTTVTLKLYPGADATGRKEYTMTGYVNRITVSMEGGNEISKRTFSIKGSGGLTKGTVA